MIWKTSKQALGTLEYNQSNLKQTDYCDLILSKQLR